MIDRETLKLFYLGWPAYYEQDAGSSSRQQARKFIKFIKSLLKYSGIRACPVISYLRLGYRQCHTAVRGRGDSSGKLNCSFRGSALCHRPGASYGRKIKRGKVKCFPKSRNRKTLIQ